tara:strand:- start:2874 stop:3917 length:1044 start_codon:yes stop_codon:yes gene_type:complete
MRILVTGGSGFIGSHLIRRLLKDKKNLVFNIDKIGYASIPDLLDTVPKEDVFKGIGKYELLKIDLANKIETENALIHASPDIVFHLAAESHVDRSIDGPEVFIYSNIIGTFNLLESSRDYWNKLDPKRKENFRFQHISTDEVFGSLGNTGSFEEKTSYDPRSPYSASKASSDHLVRSWHHTFGLPVLLSNCSNNFGPWQFPEKLIPLSILKTYLNQPIPIYGDGKNIRDWLFIDDHIEALLLIAKKGKIGESYCIGGQGERTNKEVVMKICEIMDRFYPNDSPHQNLIQYVSDRPGHDKRYSINPKKIKNQLNWQPKYYFDEALEKTVKWYLSNLDWLKKNLDKKHI